MDPSSAPPPEQTLGEYLAYIGCRYARARAFYDSLVATIPKRAELSSCHPLNDCINAMITGGCYREAVGLWDIHLAAAQDQAKEADPTNWALVQINVAEAEYNFGLINEAARRTDSLARLLVEDAASFGRDGVEPIVSSGLAMQRAWIAGLAGDAQRGLAHFAEANKADLPPRYRAEVEYTRALLLAKAGRLREAEQAAEQGLAEAMRPSSERNGLFLIGIVQAERGVLEQADRAFERGAAHHCRGQGGDGLLCWGRVLLELGRPLEARCALEWCVQRDPQSPAAESAQALLGSSEA